MRGSFVKTLVQLAEADRRVVLLTSDIGFRVVEPFSERFPDRFVNVGVAEQNMLGIATGLAESGAIPFVYSIVTFASLRPYEFIRNGPVLQHLPVRIISVGAGFEYAHNGPSHYGLEDIAIMRVQPGLTVVAPADAQQTKTALEKTWNLPGPIYYRLGKDDKTMVDGLEGRFELGASEWLKDGNDVIIIATGAIAAEAMSAAGVLDHKGISCAVSLVSSFNPAPVRDIAQTLSRFKRAISVEAHYANGGLGSFVSEVIAEYGIDCSLTRCAVKNPLNGLIGSQQFLHKENGIDSDSLIEAVLRLHR